MRGFLTITACLPALAACAASGGMEGEPVAAPAGECDASGAQHLIGQKATSEIGQELLSITGARELRWMPPRTAMTMDYRADRLTVSYDDDMVIERISCG